MERLSVTTIAVEGYSVAKSITVILSYRFTTNCEIAEAFIFALRTKQVSL